MILLLMFDIFEINHNIVNIFLLHVLVSCYTLFHFYILIESNNKSLFNNYIMLFSNKDELKFLIKTKLKLVISEQILFRVYFVEILMCLFDMNIIAPLWSIMFATYYILYYKYNDAYNLCKYAKFIYIFIMSYFILINCSLLMSCIIHCYAELIIIIIRNFIFGKFKNIKNNEPKNKFDFLNIISEKIELTNKKDVEDMLSNKKSD
jgi:hypothetical protein